jgi:2-succinyl-5-enolpyruvyl-6-hydroxy-3-cyclohexene-1-carboxylate synthase
VNASTELAHAVIDALLDAGVTDLVLAPGSRNAPLAFAAYDAEQAGAIRLHTRIDERTAGFLALGMTKAGRRAAVMCTSGTAVANLLPAVMEAAHSAIDLVVVTADRPERLRGTGASQTTDQQYVFGRFARCLDIARPEELQRISEPPDSRRDMGLPADLVDPELDRIPRSVVLHLNVQFDLPLTPTSPWAPADPEFTRGPAVGRCQMDFSTTREARLESGAPTIPTGPRTVVIAGDDAGPRARQIAEVAGWPLFAEPTSGSRTGPNALRAYRLLLGTDLGESIERVIVAGHPTLSRPISNLLDRPDVEVISLHTQGIWADRPFRVMAAHHDIHVQPGTDTAWLDSWLEADKTVSRAIDQLLRNEPDLTPHEVAGAVSAAVPAGGLLFVGASSPIRDLDLMARPWVVGQRRKAIANRGLAGIDGTISSAIGAALARPEGTRNLALMGDVTFLHDAGALVIGPEEPRPDLTIVVVNDDGGSIFTMLEQGAPEYADRYDRLFGTPHGVDIAALCAATRTPHWKVESLPELEQALASPNGGIDVIEVRVRRDNRRALDQAIRNLV